MSCIYNWLIRLLRWLTETMIYCFRCFTRWILPTGKLQRQNWNFLITIMLKLLHTRLFSGIWKRCCCAGTLNRKNSCFLEVFFIFWYRDWFQLKDIISYLNTAQILKNETECCIENFLKFIIIDSFWKLIPEKLFLNPETVYIFTRYSKASIKVLNNADFNFINFTWFFWRKMG